jgi:hypothetical protein
MRIFKSIPNTKTKITLHYTAFHSLFKIFGVQDMLYGYALFITASSSVSCLYSHLQAGARQVKRD